MRNDHHVVETGRPTGHHAVGIKRQLRPNSRPPHHPIKIGTKESGVKHTTSDRPWIVEQVIPDRFTDCEDVPRHVMMATYSDVPNLVTPEPITADELHRSYGAMRPNIEAPHTLSTSRMK